MPLPATRDVIVDRHLDLENSTPSTVHEALDYIASHGSRKFKPTFVMFHLLRWTMALFDENTLQ